MHFDFHKNSIRTIVILSLALICLATTAQAASVKKATAWYLKGNGFLKSGKYRKAASAFRRAYRLLPRHRHFNCHRAQFLNYMGRSYEKLRQHRTAMTSYYTAAYRSGCSKAATKGYAARRYRSLYNRWMCSIQFITTPPKARVYKITSSGDSLLGRTPYKKVFSPGKYNFKIRLYDHRTIYYKVELRPGRHLKRTFKMVKGDDPVTRVEKVDIAPPMPVARLSNKSTARKKVASANPTGKINLGSFSDTNGASGLDSRNTKTGTGNDLVATTSRRKKIKAGAPVYKQAWFWAVIGGVAVAAVVIPIVVPKEQKALLSQGKLF